MKRIIAALAFTLLLVGPRFAYARQVSGKPKLVVGIVVDQMRPDYLERFAAHFGSGGFLRLLREGYSCDQTNYTYVPTYTAPGHACIYTGAPPCVNGIIGNDWFDRRLGAEVYCVTDTTAKPVGTQSASGMMSPHRLLAPTVTDALRVATGFRSKVIGISLKDRGAIIPAGLAANAAYWHDPSTNSWVSSTYYMKELPAWMKAYNDRKRADFFLSSPWTTLLPESEYTESTADSTPYEGLLAGETSPVFPHNLPAIRSKDPDLIRKTPFGNTFTLEVAMEAIKGEQLGKGDATDFITISFSSTDYIGHIYGLHAMELEDAYIRLDRDLETLLTFLDEWVGKGNTLVFLSADHGAAENVQYSRDHHIPGGLVEFSPVADSLESYLERTCGAGNYIMNATVNGIYLNEHFLHPQNAPGANIPELCASWLRQFPWVAAVFTASELEQQCVPAGPGTLLARGHCPIRSPDVSLALKPGWMDAIKPTGTTHGSAYSCDTHVPLIFYGWHVPHGSTVEPTDACDIAPTISQLLGIAPPAASTGKPVSFLSR